MSQPIFIKITVNSAKYVYHTNIIKLEIDCMYGL